MKISTNNLFDFDILTSASNNDWTSCFELRQILVGNTAACSGSWKPERRVTNHLWNEAISYTYASNLHPKVYEHPKFMITDKHHYIYVLTKYYYSQSSQYHNFVCIQCNSSLLRRNILEDCKTQMIRQALAGKLQE